MTVIAARLQFETSCLVNMSTKDEPYITSIDCKILQYKYAIHKIKCLIPFVQQLQAAAKDLPKKDATEAGSSEEDSSEENKKVKHLIICHYLTVLCGNVFAINEGLFNTKLESINNYKLFRIPPINISPIVSHIPYDTNDPAISPLESLPGVDQSIKVCKLLETLLQNCLQGYEKRLIQAQNEIKNQHEYNDETFDKLIQGLFDKDIDIGAPTTDFTLPLQLDSLNDLVYNEASLIDIDIKMLFIIIINFKKILNHLKLSINKYLKIKQVPLKSQQAYLQKQIPNWQFSLHRIFLLTLRLNDLYLILRRFIRKVYLSNLNHLSDPKFLSINNSLSNQTGHSVYYFRTLLKKVDENFNNSKKNGVLIANLTRFIRQNSKFVTNPKNILDFINFNSQGHYMIATQISMLQEFSSHWIEFELYFRQYHGLPVENLHSIVENINSDEADLLSDENHTSNSMPPPGVKIHKEGLEKPVVTRPSRSSSVSSNNSNNSNNSNLPPNDPFLTRKSSINKNRTSMTGTSPRQQRPNSMIFLNNHQNSSSNSLPVKPASQTPQNNHLDPQNITSPNQNVNTTPTGRRRSNSQPQASPERLQSPSSPVGIAASGAAAALKHNNNSNNTANGNNTNNNISIKRLPSNSRTRPIRSPPPTSTASSISSNSMTSNTSIISPVTGTTTKGSPVANRVQPIVEEELQIQSNIQKLSANQRLQHHLRQAAKSGTLMTQERETLTSVVFDPNSPSAINLKRYHEKEIAGSNEVASASVDPQTNGTATIPENSNGNVNTKGNGGAATAPLRRKTRDQVTKLNTKRNSELLQITSTNESNSSSDRSTRTGNIEPEVSLNLEVDSQNNVVKRVRFFGVPDYTEAEDAPTKYANRILKNFAVFKSPSKPGFKRKDQMLKKEESLSFKSQLHQTQHQTQNLLLDQLARGTGQTTAQAQAQAYMQAQHGQPSQSNSPFLSNPLQNTKLKLKSRLT